MMLLTHDVLLRRRRIASNYVVHAVFLSIASLGEKLSIGLLVVEGDRPWLEVVVKRRYMVGVYDEGDRVRIVEDDNYISSRAYNLLISKRELYGNLIMYNPYGIASTLYLTPSTGRLRMHPTTGTLKLRL